MTTEALKIESLSLSFSRKIINSGGADDNEQYWVLNELSLSIPKGKVIALIGGNGAGKTTLFNIISGFLIPDQGRAIYKGNGDGCDLVGLAPHKIANLGIGRMFQDNHIFHEMSVLDNMLISEDTNSNENPIHSLLFKKKNSVNEARGVEKVEAIFENLFGSGNSFWQKRNILAGNLSFGQQRLLGLARLFMREYTLLLLDEPTAGVNPDVIEQIKRMIKNFVEKQQTVLLIEHNLDVVRDIADFCCYMDQGRIVLMGTPNDVIGNEEVRRSYIGL